MCRVRGIARVRVTGRVRGKATVRVRVRVRVTGRVRGNDGTRVEVTYTVQGKARVPRYMHAVYPYMVI